MTTKTMRKKYIFRSREEAEFEFKSTQTRSQRLYWMIVATESGELRKVGRKGDYSIAFVPSPRRHSDCYCLRHQPKGDHCPNFEFFDSSSQLYAHLADIRKYHDSENPDSVVFDCLMFALSGFMEPD